MNQLPIRNPSFAPEIGKIQRPFLERFWPGFLLVLMALSSIVQKEPAPYDFLLLGGMLLFVFTGQRFAAPLIWPAICIFLVIFGYAIGAMFAIFRDDAFSYIRTSTYLSVSCLFVAALVWRYPERVVPPMAIGLVIASVIAALLGILGYFNAIPNAQAYAVYGRATGPFKDPNVFGPSLIFPALYLVQRMASRPLRELVLTVPLLLLLLSGLFLSFSRGAWMNFVVASLVLLALTAVAAPAAERRRLLRFAWLVLVLLAVMIAWALSIPAVRTLFIQRFALAEDYDAAEGGRFDNMYAAFETALANPWGIGPDQWPHISAARLMPHDIYVNVFVSGGLISLTGWVGLTVFTLWAGLGAIRRHPPMPGVLAAATGTFVGHTLEGFIIDSNHWRHLFVVIGLIWGLALAATGLARRRVSASAMPQQSAPPLLRPP